MEKQKLRRLTMAALCGAVAFVLMYFSFSVPVLSPFAEFDLSALPELIGGFVFEMNFRRLDASVAAQLRSIRRQFVERNRRIV